MAKRKLDSTPDSKRDPQSKRPKVQLRDTSKQVGAHSAGPADTNSAPPASDKTGGKGKQLEGEKPGRQDGSEASGSRTATTVKQRVRKLAPPRPFPTVPASVSATGPRSAHTEGKNYICITRRTELGAYLRRCKDVFLEDGYNTLHLSAMGAAIPHLMQLALSLPSILPFPQDEIHTEVLTGTVEVQDELIPDDEDEDISYRTRGKSTVSVVIKVGDGSDEPAAPPKQVGGKKNNTGSRTPQVGGAAGQAAGKSSGKKGHRPQTKPEQIVFREDEMDES